MIEIPEQTMTELITMQTPALQCRKCRTDRSLLRPSTDTGVPASTHCSLRVARKIAAEVCMARHVQQHASTIWYAPTCMCTCCRVAPHHRPFASLACHRHTVHPRWLSCIPRHAHVRSLESRTCSGENRFAWCTAKPSAEGANVVHCILKACRSGCHCVYDATAGSEVGLSEARKLQAVFQRQVCALVGEFNDNAVANFGMDDGSKKAQVVIVLDLGLERVVCVAHVQALDVLAANVVLHTTDSQERNECMRCQQQLPAVATSNCQQQTAARTN